MICEGELFANTAGVDFTPHVVTVYTGEFPSMASLHGALPNVAAPAGLLSTSSLGTPSTSWMPSQSSYPSAMPAQVMADSAVKMVKVGCQYITVLGVDFMSENVRAILYQAGFLEIGGESLRIYKREIQENVLEIVGISPEQAEAKFGYLMDALDMGAPPHVVVYIIVTVIIHFIGGDTLQYFDGYGYHGASLEQTYRCYPASFIDKVGKLSST
ncbi:uncharacterized protein LOC114264283 [Camellia sinensis]|uniref:uncharacterized protein LOC114264283 n=1 Tax=Camellia sinensis TaxID=4442 RepID=UPI001036E4BA|nr:uncharacterized protein LOC114264283 [Camellia sinensis]